MLESQLYDGSLVIEGLDPLMPETIPLDQLASSSDATFRINSYTYPQGAGVAGSTMQQMITVLLLLITVCAVLQIFLSQIKRRSRRIALMKAIGADNTQVLRMLLWEAWYLLVCALPIGSRLGVGIAGIVIGAMNDSGIVIAVQWPRLLWGLAGGVAALYIGMLVPMIRALNIPSMGAMESERRYRTKDRQSAKACASKHAPNGPEKCEGKCRPYLDVRGFVSHDGGSTFDCTILGV